MPKKLKKPTRNKKVSVKEWRSLFTDTSDQTFKFPKGTRSYKPSFKTKKAIKKQKKISKNVDIHFSKLPKKAGEPNLSKAQFNKALKTNIENYVNTGQFSKAKPLIDVYKKSKAGKLTPQQRREYELKKEYVGQFSITKSSEGTDYFYRSANIFNKKNVDKVIPDDTLSGSQLDFLKKHLGYSSKAVKAIKNNQLKLKDHQPMSAEELNASLRDKWALEGTWSGNAKFDTIVEKMGGFTVAINRYYKQLKELGKKYYNIDVDAVVAKYAKYFFGA